MPTAILKITGFFFLQLQVFFSEILQVHEIGVNRSDIIVCWNGERESTIMCWCGHRERAGSERTRARAREREREFRMVALYFKHGIRALSVCQ